jgi:hypothetical protein
MDERSRKVGRNEALFRQLNEELEVLARQTAPTTNNVSVVCECGDLRCAERIILARDLYQHVRSDPALFVVLPGHETPAVEDVVETSNRHYVVRKREGPLQALAEATNPRA